jgi:hypothetical protein
MSTYQPPGEPPSYAQPQDPWADAHQTGVAATPTDPIPQPQPQQPQPQPQARGYGQFTPGVAAPSVWTQETIAHGGGYEYVPQRSRLGTYVLIILAVIVLGGGGGYGAYLLISRLPDNTTTPPPSGSTSTTQPGQTPTVAAADLKVNDCISNIGSNEDAILIKVACDAANSYKVLKVVSGESIPENPDGKFGDETKAVVCKDFDQAKTTWYALNSGDDTKDFFVCLDPN